MDVASLGGLEWVDMQGCMGVGIAIGMTVDMVSGPIPRLLGMAWPSTMPGGGTPPSADIFIVLSTR